MKKTVQVSLLRFITDVPLPSLKQERSLEPVLGLSILQTRPLNKDSGFQILNWYFLSLATKRCIAGAGVENITFTSCHIFDPLVRCKLECNPRSTSSQQSLNCRVPASQYDEASL